jgi:hypothetical protein
MQAAASVPFIALAALRRYVRDQTVEQLLNGQQVEYPRYARDSTFKQAPRSRPAPASKMRLPLDPSSDAE